MGAKSIKVNIVRCVKKDMNLSILWLCTLQEMLWLGHQVWQLGKFISHFSAAFLEVADTEFLTSLGL